MLVVRNLKNLFMSMIYMGFSENLNSPSQQVDLAEKSQQSENKDSLLNPEQQELVENYKQQLDYIKSNLKHVDGYANRLTVGLNKLETTEQNDPEFLEFKKNIHDKITGLGQEYLQLKSEGIDIAAQLEKINIIQDNLQVEIDQQKSEMGINTNIQGDIEQNRFSQEEMKGLKNEEFLSLPVEQRLKYVTEGSREYSSVINGNSENIRFTFDQDGNGIDDSDLYKKTTLGQVLGAEVGSVESAGVTYTRLGEKGEFFNGKERLLIKTGTEISCNMRTDEEMKSLFEGNQKQYDAFFENNNDYDQTKFGETVRIAIEEGIEPLLFANLANRRIDNLGTNLDGESIQIESLANELGQTLSGLDFNLENGQYSLETTANLLRVLIPATWKITMMKELGFEQADVLTYATKTKGYQGGVGKLENYLPAEYSYGAEKSDSGTTLCSRTARKNLMKMGIDAPAWGLSAKNSYETYRTPSEKFPPSGESTAKVADFYLDASPKNAEYGHRVAAFQENGKWYVLDPYYNAQPGVDTRAPIPAETYISYMENKGRKMWGAHYFNEGENK